MSRRGRLRPVLLLALAATLGPWGGSALADHCPPIDNPDPVPGQNTTYCHTPQPTAAPKTPKPTPKATTEPTAAPQTAAPAPQAPVRSRAPVSTPATTPFEIEVPEEPAATTEIVVDPLDEATVLEVEEAGGASNTIIGFIVGFIVGGLVGRMSWGIRRRRRQQIFG